MAQFVCCVAMWKESYKEKVMAKTKRFKKVRLHQEGTPTLILSFVSFFVLNGLAYLFFGINSWVLYVVFGITLVLLGIIVNFFRCPIRVFEDETENTVVAPADGKVVVVEEVDENDYFHDRRLMISVFMSVTNVHANWFPVAGLVKKVVHHNGAFYKAWLPKASEQNERSEILIETDAGDTVLVRQVAGAVARRIVTYPREGDRCYIDEHLGFIKFGSRVDVYLPLNSKPLVKIGDKTVGNITVIAKLNSSETVE